jgi:signal transduction histidine kinase
MAATMVVNLLAQVSIGRVFPLVVGNVAEPLIIAGLIHRQFGESFSIDRLHHVIGLFVAAVVGTIVTAAAWTFVHRLAYNPLATNLTLWQHWFTSELVGISVVAPLLLGLASALRRPPPRNELIEGISALAALVVMTLIIVSLPQELWQTVAPGALLFPMLLWLAACCRPAFATAGAFTASLTIVWATVFGMGHFGDNGLPLEIRVLQAQTVIIFVALGTLALAALFTERRESETRLAHSNKMLERERDNKLMSAQAVTAAISHEIRQPLTAIATNASAALRWLGRTPPDHGQVRAALNRIKTESLYTGEVFDGFRALFGKVDQGRGWIDVNEIILGALHSLRGELNDHRVTIRPELTSELPLLVGHTGQLREVIFNLVHNAIDAMDTTTDRSRELQVRTELRGHDAIVVSVQDSGPGIDPKRLDGIFGSFVTTKAHGTGLGLAICRMIIEHHGGRLSAWSDGESGALFQFILPIKTAVESRFAG